LVSPTPLPGGEGWQPSPLPASPRWQVVAAGMAAGMEVSQLADLEIAYPTYTAIVGLAARQLVRELGRVDLAPSWRALSRLRAIEWERSDTLRTRERNRQSRGE
ncbi:MAG: hypothetical protein SNJ69_17800, partial [Chloroflexaceae bacterium]